MKQMEYVENLTRNNVYHTLELMEQMLDNDTCKIETIDGNEAMENINDYLKIYKDSLERKSNRPYMRFLFNELDYLIRMNKSMIENNTYKGTKFSTHEIVQTAFNYIHNSIEFTLAHLTR